MTTLPIPPPARAAATAGVAGAKDRRPGQPSVDGLDHADAVDARVQDARAGGRGRIQRQGADVAGGGYALLPVEAAVGRNEDAGIGGEVDGLGVGRIDDDDSDQLTEKDARIARRAGRIGSAELDPARAAVGRLEEPRRRLGRFRRAGEHRALAARRSSVDHVRVDRVDRQRAGIADPERRCAIEDRRPGDAAVAAEPDAAPRRADVDDVGVVRVDGDRGDLTIGVDRALVDRARADWGPNGSVEAHGSDPFPPGGTSSGGSGLFGAGGLIDGRTTAPGRRLHCSRASA